MHNPESVLENETDKILWDLEIQTDHSIPSRRPDLILINKKKNLPTCGFCYSSGQYSEYEYKQKDRQILGFCQRAEYLCNMIVTVMPVVDALQTVSMGLEKKQEMRRIIETIQTTSSLRWFAAIQIPDKDHQLKLI